MADIPIESVIQDVEKKK